MTQLELLEKAKEAMETAYAPYSNFKVGAALETENGVIYTGCNIENSSYGVCNCAERTALFKAISEGQRHFRRMAIVGGKNGIFTDFCYPCGVCRQALSEFVDPSFPILLQNEKGKLISTTLGELLPEAFALFPTEETDL